MPKNIFNWQELQGKRLVIDIETWAPEESELVATYVFVYGTDDDGAMYLLHTEEYLDD